MSSLNSTGRFGMILLLLVGSLNFSMEASAESKALNIERLGDAEQLLSEAAKESPHWHSRRDFIQRDIHDITFMLEQSLRSAEKSNHAERKYYAQQALTLLERGVGSGHFHAGQTKPVLSLLRQLLAEQPS
jgi:hypothetical protein